MTATTPETNMYGMAVAKCSGTDKQGQPVTVWLVKPVLEKPVWAVFATYWTPGWEYHEKRDSADARYQHLVRNLTDVTTHYGG